MGADADCHLIQSLIAGVDHTAQQAETKWGVGRLPMLVSDATREKFIRQQRRWRQALEAAWLSPVLPKPVEDALRATCGGMQRAWAALDVEATANGHSALAPTVWEVSLKDGTVAAIVKTTEEAIAVTRDDRARVVYSLDEIASLLDAFGKLGDLKGAFPGSVVQPIHTFDGPKVGGSRGDYAWVEKGDEVPF